MDAIVITGAGLSAAIGPLGAELQWLRDADGRDLMWSGDPAWWTGRAPILFPVIGCVNDGVIRVDGRDYPMAKHGFARTATFAVIAREEGSATFRIAADDATRRSYPFDFTLDIRFAIEGACLMVTATLANPADTVLPASFGFHPALRWPLPYGAPRGAHRVTFAETEAAPIRRIDGAGLLRTAPEPTPIEGDTLVPRDALFEDDALIFDALASRRVTYGAPGTPALEVSFPDMDLLGIWTKPGAPYLCIEPWCGIADPEAFAGEYRDKPGVIAVPPHGARDFTLRIARIDAMPGE